MKKEKGKEKKKEKQKEFGGGCERRIVSSSVSANSSGVDARSFELC